MCVRARARPCVCVTKGPDPLERKRPNLLQMPARHRSKDTLFEPWAKASDGEASSGFLATELASRGKRWSIAGQMLVNYSSTSEVCQT